MKKFIIFTMIIVALVDYNTLGTELCGDYRINHKAIRHCKSVDQLNYFMYRQFKCPDCSWARSVKYF